VTVFFNEYPALLHLESDLIVSEIPSRPADNKALGMHFTNPKTAANSKKAVIKSEEGGGTLREGSGSKDTETDNEGHNAVTGGAEERSERAHGREPVKANEKLVDEQFAQLSRELDAATSYINGGSKLKGFANPIPSMNETWVRSSKVRGDATYQSFRGLGLIENHTFEWGKEVGPSRHRFATTLAQLCILEQAIVNTYRLPLLGCPNSAAAFIRLRIEEATRQYHAKPITTQRHPTLIKRQTEKQSQNSFVWADRLSYDVVVTRKTSFDLEEELGTSQTKALQDEQRQEIQKVINTIENTSSAWAVNTVLRDRDCVEKPDVLPVVQSLMEELVKVSIAAI
jgi:hypothetical protein